MVYINLQDTAPVVYIPANGWPFRAADMAVTLRNTVDGNELALGVTAASRQGFLVKLALAAPSGAYAGEWDYRAVAGDTVVASGLCCIYDGEKPGSVEYESELNVIQYAG